MKTEWDYTNLADAYLKRPDYSEIAIDSMIKLTDIVENDKICDVGAGVAHLTLMLAKRKFNVSAIEPNDAMRKMELKEQYLLKMLFGMKEQERKQTKNQVHLKWLLLVVHLMFVIDLRHLKRFLVF